MSSITITLRRPQTLLQLVTKSYEQHPHPQEQPPREPDPPIRLLSFSEIPLWYRDNPYILTAYRPVSHSFSACLHSLAYFHNETLNIYTHLLPALALLPLFTPPLQRALHPHLPTPHPLDHAIFTLNLLAALATFALSAAYHTCMSHSHPVAAACLRIDYAGILLLILASFLSGIHVGFYCSPPLQLLYGSMITVLAAATAMLVLNPALQGPKWRALRTAAFVATALSGFAPIAHGLVLYGWSDMWAKSGMRFWLGEGVAYGIGAAVFARRVPERWVWGWSGRGSGEKGLQDRGRWVDLVGCSHQVFHVCVVFGAAVHLWGVWDAWGWVGRGEGLGGCSV